eukprot:1352877-Pyramimonas_sp.AAC.1
MRARAVRAHPGNARVLNPFPVTDVPPDLTPNLGLGRPGRGAEIPPTAVQTILHERTIRVELKCQGSRAGGL